LFFCDTFRAAVRGKCHNGATSVWRERFRDRSESGISRFERYGRQNGNCSSSQLRRAA